MFSLTHIQLKMDGAADGGCGGKSMSLCYKFLLKCRRFGADLPSLTAYVRSCHLTLAIGLPVIDRGVWCCSKGMDARELGGSIWRAPLQDNHAVWG